MTAHDPRVTLTEAEVDRLRATHRDSYPMGNAHHGTPLRPDWGTFCVECKESWPCEVSLLLDHIAHLEAQHAARLAPIRALAEAVCETVNAEEQRVADFNARQAERDLTEPRSGDERSPWTGKHHRISPIYGRLQMDPLVELARAALDAAGADLSAQQDHGGGEGQGEGEKAGEALREAAAWIAETIGYPVEVKMPDHPMPEALWQALVDHVYADREGKWHGNELDREDTASWLAEEAGR